MEPNISEKFNQVRNQITKLINGEDMPHGKDSDSNELLQIQKSLEELTRVVSAVEMFSKNEVYKEMDPKALKFLLLPYFLGVVWQRKKNVERKDIWSVAEVYFRDFLERLMDVEILTSKPNVLKVMEAAKEESESGDKSASTQPQKSSLSLADEHDARRAKIARFKLRKELEKKIKVLEERQKESGEDQIEESLDQELALSMLRMCAIDAQEELESIVTEKELVKWKIESQGKPIEPVKPTKSGLPFETFIITKSDAQKRVFGRGYPSVPVMTVEELYRDRVEKGIWADPTASTTSNQPHGNEVQDPETEQEILEENGDEDLRARQQAMDEYKDTHRRGWGNRMNRS